MAGRSIRRGDEGRLYLGARHRGRQTRADREPDDDAAAQALGRRARSRRRLSCRIGRGSGPRRRRHQLHGARALCRHRRRVRDHRRRRSAHRRRPFQAYGHRHGREDSRASPPRGERDVGTRLGAAARQSVDSLECRGGEGRPVGNADAAERDHAHLLREDGDDQHARARGGVQGAARSEDRGRRAEISARAQARRLLGAAHVGRADHPEGRCGRQRHSIGSGSHARHPRAARREHRSVLCGAGEGD